MLVPLHLDQHAALPQDLHHRLRALTQYLPANESLIKRGSVLVELTLTIDVAHERPDGRQTAEGGKEVVVLRAVGGCAVDKAGTGLRGDVRTI